MKTILALALVAAASVAQAQMQPSQPSNDVPEGYSAQGYTLMPGPTTIQPNPYGGVDIHKPNQPTIVCVPNGHGGVVCN